MNTRILPLTILGSILVMSTGCGLVGQPGAEVPSVPIGQESQQLNCAYENGFNICPPIQETYLKYQEQLGPPIQGFDILKKEQCFLFGCLSYNPANEKEWQVQFVNVGSFEMRARGLPLVANPEMHPIFREEILSEEQHGIDTGRTIGKLVSNPMTDKAGKVIQFAEKVGVMIDPTTNQLQRLPLGLSYTHQPPPSPAKPFWQNLGIAPVAVGLGLLGLVVFFSKRSSKRGPGGRTL